MRDADGRAGISAAGAHLLHGGQSPYGAALLSHIRTVPLSASDLFKTVITVPAEVSLVYTGGEKNHVSEIILRDLCYRAAIFNSSALFPSY